MDLYDSYLNVGDEDIEIVLQDAYSLQWADFWLNPRYLRGADFLMRWSQGAWSEERLIEAINATGRYYALPYGPSGVAPEEPRELELYFERLQAAGLDDSKRPDILIFPVDARQAIDDAVERLGGKTELPFTPDDAILEENILNRAVLAVECENSLWIASRMPAYGKLLRPMARLGQKCGMPKGAVLPTIIIKNQDRVPLHTWEERFGVPIHIWHVFYDLAFGIALDRAEKLITEGDIEVTTQVFQAPSGATTEKGIYKIYYHHAYLLAESTEEAELIADKIIDRNGHILPYVRFEGGALRIAETALVELAKAADAHNARGE